MAECPRIQPLFPANEQPQRAYRDRWIDSQIVFKRNYSRSTTSQTADEQQDMLQANELAGQFMP